MKLVKITHLRCGEFRAATYVMAPNEWSEDEIDDKVFAAQEEYLADLSRRYQQKEEEHKSGKVVYMPSPPNLIQIKDAQGDKTIAEVWAEYEEKRAEYDAWSKEDRKGNNRFDHYLKKQGFSFLWECEGTEVEADWGHRHGSRLDYTDTVLDEFPKIKVALGEDVDDWC